MSHDRDATYRGPARDVAALGAEPRRSASRGHRSEVWRRARKEDPTTPVAGSAPRDGPTYVALSSPGRSRCASTPSRHPGRTLVVEALGRQRPRAARAAAGVHQQRRRPVPGRRHQRAQAVRRTARSPTRRPAADRLRQPARLDPRRRRRLPLRQERDHAPRTTTRSHRAAPRPASTAWTRRCARLTAGQLIQRDPPAPGGGLATPAWPFPDPATFLDVLRKAAAGRRRRLPDATAATTTRPGSRRCTSRPTPWPGCTSRASRPRRPRPTCR